MFQRITGSLLTIAFVLAMFVAGTHVHIGEVDHQADCTVCRVAHQPLQSVEKQCVTAIVAWTFVKAGLTDSVWLTPGQELFREAPKTSPPLSFI